MKILLIHTKYGYAGGEDIAFFQERDLLSGHHNIESLIYQNCFGPKGALQFFTALWNFRSARTLKQTIKRSRPQLIHLHNWHFAAGPIVIRVAKKCGIPVVVTLHNFRLICPSGILMHNGQVYFDSITKTFPWLAIKKGVYRNSVLLTFWLSLTVWFHRKLGTWSLIDRWIVLTEFAKEILVRSSIQIPETKFRVKPNFIKEPSFVSLPRSRQYLYVGRLSSEKGIQVMLETFRASKFPLRIAGDGPLKAFVLEQSDVAGNIKYLGKLDKDAILNEMRLASALILPSICIEGLPMTLIEAFSVGTPVIGSNLGPISFLIKHMYNGLHFKAGNSSSLIDQLQHWEALQDPEKDQIRKNAYTTYIEKYTADQNLEQLTNIYQEVLEEHLLN